MKILKNRQIKEVQEEFRNLFPGLKIKFYNKAHASHQLSSKESEISNEAYFAEAFETLKEDDLPINPRLSVKEFEQMMEDRCNVYVQVFRRSNDMWIQTSMSDDWSLGDQNTKGMHSYQINQK